MNRRMFLGAMGAAGFSPSASRANPLPPGQPPNIIFILCDDLGFGDLGCYGAKLSTPNIDRLSTEGVQLRQFCAPSAVCSPSRAGYLTGRYGVRVGVPQVLQPNDRTGLNPADPTIAEVLKSAGYRTACIGKWHLGTMANMMPTRRGFDEYFGLLHSNDQRPLALIRQTSVIESPVDLERLSGRYTEEAIGFITRNAENPFLLYLPHWAPHIPLVASPEFQGKSPLGLYGDVMAELDAGVGRILDTLKQLGLDENTLILFTSDNGPWFQGSAGPHRGRKGDTFEGGMRVPFLARWPSRIPAGRVLEHFASGLDLMPTLASVAGAPLPERALDGADIFPLLSGLTDRVGHPPFFYFDHWDLQAIRVGKWKLHVARHNTPAFVSPPIGGRLNLRLLNPELYDLDADPGESYSVADENPKVVADLNNFIQRLLPSFPLEVRMAWNQTQNRPVEGQNPGAFPRSAN